jgi:hypothetical protein
MKKDPEKMKKNRKFIKIFLITIVVLLLLVGAGIFFIRLWILSKMPPDMRDYYHVWSSKPLHFNPADIEAPPFEMKTAQAAIKFREEWEKHKEPALKIAEEYKIYIKGEDDGAPETISLEKELPKLDPLIQAFQQLIERDDYEIDAMVTAEDPKDMPGIPVSNFMQFQVSVKIMGLKAWQLVNDGKISEALNMAETMIKASKSHPFSILISQLIAIAGFSLGTETWHYVISLCEDPELLRSALIRQNELAPQKGFITPDINLNVSDNIGMIRMAQRFGIATDIEGKTGREIMGEWFRVEGEFQENVILPATSNPSEIERIKQLIKGYRNSSALFGGETKSIGVLGYRLVSPVICPLMFRIAVPNFEEARTREKAALAKYDLLRLYTAKKLFFLEHQKEPEKMEDLVPEYIPELLIDPFTEKEPFRKESFFYSIGPDELDQKGAILYDPTNGTITPGDIFFAP